LAKVYTERFQRLHSTFGELADTAKQKGEDELADWMNKYQKLAEQALKDTGERNYQKTTSRTLSKGANAGLRKMGYDKEF
jgi:hypothetical protein